MIFPYFWPFPPSFFLLKKVPLLKSVGKLLLLSTACLFPIGCQMDEGGKWFQRRKGNVETYCSYYVHIIAKKVIVTLHVGLGYMKNFNVKFWNVLKQNEFQTLL